MYNSRLKDKAEAFERNGGGRRKLLVGSRADYGDFEIYIVSSSTPGLEQGIMAWTHRHNADGTIDRATWTSGYLIEAMQPTLRAWKDVYGGEWHLEIRNTPPVDKFPCKHPGAFAKAQGLVLAGPDTPGRRFLLRRKKLAETMGLPPEPARQEYATKAMLAAVRDPGQEG